MSARTRTSARTHVRRLGLATVVAAALIVPVAAAAQAHVTVRPESTSSGDFTQLVFRVPNESATARTVKVKVTLPESDPLLYVSVQPIPGWTAKVTETALPKPIESYGATLTKAPRTVTWTANAGGGLAAGEYQNFAISAGPLPDEGELSFPATQTYSDGEVVRWTQPQKAGEEEPEHPVPAFTVTTATAPAATPAASVESTSDDATALAVAALVVGGIGLVAGTTALVVTARGRRNAQEA